MTINGFWKELSEYQNISQFRVPFSQWIKEFYEEHKRFPRIGVDLYQMIFESLPNESAFPTSSKNIRHVISVLLNKIYALIGYNTNFVFVFDGGLTKGKLRNNGTVPLNSSYAPQYIADNDSLTNRRHYVRHPLIIEIKRVFDLLNIKYMTAANDGEIELARLNDCNEIDAIVSNDADIFVYGGKCLLRNFSKSDKDLPSSSGDHSSSNAKYYVTPITIEFLNSIDVDRNSMAFIAISAGDDYSNGWKGLGVHRSIVLGSTKLPFSKALKEIYVPTNSIHYIKGEIISEVSERISSMNRLISKINAFILERGKSAFGRACSCQILPCSSTPTSDDSPNDYNNMLHFYPLTSPILFKFESYSMNSGQIDKISNFIPYIPQSCSLLSSTPVQIHRGSENCVLGYTDFSSNETVFTSLEALNNTEFWFQRPEFKTLKDYYNSNSSNPEALLLNKFTKCYLFRIIVCMDFLDLEHDDIQITQRKAAGESYSRRVFDDNVYRVSYKPQKCMGNLLDIKLINENGISLFDKVENEWLPEYLLKSQPNGRKLIENYEMEQIEKQKKSASPTSRSRTPKHSPQKSNLLILSKSPFKIIGQTKSDLGSRSNVNSPEKKEFNFDLNKNIFSFNQTSTTLAKSKRFSELSGENESPKKRSRLAHKRGESITDVFKNKYDLPVDLGTRFETFEKDEEVSRILGDDDYVGELPDESGIEKQEDDILFDKKILPTTPKNKVITLDDSFSDGSVIPISEFSNDSIRILRPSETNNILGTHDDQLPSANQRMYLSPVILVPTETDLGSEFDTEQSDTRTIRNDSAKETPTTSKNTPLIEKNTLNYSAASIRNQIQVVIDACDDNRADISETSNISASSNENLMSIFD